MKFYALAVLIALGLSTLVLADEKREPTRHYVEQAPTATERTAFQSLLQSYTQIEAKERELAEAKKQVRTTLMEMSAEAAEARKLHARLYYDPEHNVFFTLEAAPVQSADASDVAPVESARIPKKRARLSGHKP